MPVGSRIEGKVVAVLKAGTVTVMPLIDAAGPTAEAVGLHPSPDTRRPGQPKIVPGLTFRRVFQHAAIVSDGCERSCEAAAIFAQTELVGLASTAVPEPAPACAWRMCDYRMRPGIEPGIPRLVPRINAIQAEIAACRFNKERREPQSFLPDSIAAMRVASA